MAYMESAVLNEKGLRAEFIQAFMDAPSIMPELATVVQSSSDSEKYAWLGESPTMSEFLDERQIKDLSETSYSIPNKTWEATIGVSRSDLEDDQVGGIRLRIDDLAQRARQHVDCLLFETIENGTSATLGLGYDGVSFFNDAHPDRGTAGVGTQDNLLAGTGTGTSALKTDLQVAIQTLHTFKDEQNKPFHPMIRPEDLVVVVPPGLKFAMMEAVNAALISNTSNILVGAVRDVIVSPYLTDADDWYLFKSGAGQALKPMIFQDRMGVEFRALEGESDNGFLREKYLYGVRARYAIGFGQWQNAVKTTN